MPFSPAGRRGPACHHQRRRPASFNTNLLQEYAILADTFGYDETGLTRIARNAFVAAGVEDDVKS
ncbi:MAG: hypothetical protein IPJ94_19670 [Chloroflexi bacterium]|nr:hypothetical protein [Chloroflexota bacterium]